MTNEEKKMKVFLRLTDAVGKMVLYQRPHDLLRRLGCADVGENEVPVSLLSIAHPACGISGHKPLGGGVSI